MKTAKKIPMQPGDDAGFRRDFSHSERAGLYPEVPISNMGPSRQWGVSDLDARGSAAAGRKLTLEQGLRADFRHHRRKGRDCSLPLARKRVF
jgi:hypothetical protein